MNPPSSSQSREGDSRRFPPAIAVFSGWTRARVVHVPVEVSALMPRGHALPSLSQPLKQMEASMTAFPTLAYLHRHALPAYFLADLSVGCRSGAPSVPTRPRLVATWHVGARGRLVCRWSVERAFSGPSG
jgi:hypothetical protein